MDRPDYEPDDMSLVRIKLRLGQGRYDELLQREKTWLCERLIPSLVCHGRYPPPSSATRRA